ncbi:hypothetical protein BD414DRAFT_469660 [Trametes punicea]|nr:hypothetical protein BD414DRAFT_469660 [Trametes punicea]
MSTGKAHRILNDAEQLRGLKDITADMVFERDTESPDDLRRDIALLTVIAKQLKDGVTQPGDIKIARSDDKAKFNILRHISTLLTTGHFRDRTAATVNAVTGLIEPGGVASLICAANERATSEGSPSRPAISSVAVDSEEGRRLLESWPTVKDPPSNGFFETHVEQIGSILSYMLGMPLEERVRIRTLERDLRCFMIRRARWKLAARIENAERLWGGHPFAIMRKWYARQSSPFAEATVIFRDIDKDLAELMARHNLFPLAPDQPKCYPLTSTNIGYWLDALEDPLRRILDALGDKKTPPSLRKTSAISLAMMDFHALLQSSLFHELKTHGVEDELRSMYMEPKKIDKALALRKQKQDNQAAQEDIAEDIAEVIQDALQEAQDEESASSEPETGENMVLHLQRYLHTITAWHTAATAMVFLKIKISQLNLFVLKSTPQLDISLYDVTAFLDSYTAQLKRHVANPGSLKVCINKLKTMQEEKLSGRKRPLDVEKIKNQLSIHAEAALIALAWEFAQGLKVSLGSTMRLEAFFSMGGNTIIGVSKKCCWCCHFLHTALQGYEARNKLVFILPGTHSVIYPWLPPSGIPEKILKDMRASLFTRLHHEVLAPLPQYSSDQSSPVEVEDYGVSLEDQRGLQKDVGGLNEDED